MSITPAMTVQLLLVAAAAMAGASSLDVSGTQTVSRPDVWNSNKIRDTGKCKISLVESIPEDLVYPNGSVPYPSTYATWLDLIGSARNSIEITSMYWSINHEDVHPNDGSNEGDAVFQALLAAGKDRGITIKNVLSQISSNTTSIDYLVAKANAQVRILNFTAISGNGIFHTKLWLIDRTHLYVGSANMDWRALTQNMELGLVAFNCPWMAGDLAKIFDVYWTIGATGKVPAFWPKSLSTDINVDNPMSVSIDGNTYKSFIGSSPPPFSPDGRTSDIDGLLYCIRKAKKFIYISVMHYYPLLIFTPKLKYWPIIENALKAAAIERNVNVRLLTSKWKYSEKVEDYFLKSLEDLTNSYENVKIETKRFKFPKNRVLDKIPHARVNHNKFIVTDSVAYIGTNNWSGDYFIYNAGVGVVFEDADSRNVNSVRSQLKRVFERNWSSPYAHAVNASRNRPGASK